MKYLPIFADLSSQRVVVAGGGEAALAKLRLLLKTEAQIQVYAIDAHSQIIEWHDENRLELISRGVEHGDLTGAKLLYSAYEDDALDQRIAAMGRDAGVWTNVVDTPEYCDFITPAMVDRDPVVVAIGTEGTAPVLARQIKADLEARLSPRLGMMARVAKGIRGAVEALPFGRARRDYWSGYFQRSDIQTEAQAQSILEADLAMALNGETKPGFVSFVGAGPGDPELLTLKARKRLDAADVVIYDRLVSDEILELARREAQLIKVGKEGYGPSWKQEDINQAIITHAEKGANVVRLKGGDPSIYGRLDEETEALDGSKIDFEVVPGITTASAGAASLGQSLTRRGRNSELRFITGRDARGYAEHDWRALAQHGAVAAIYMGAKTAHFLQGRLLMHGAMATTPVTILANVSRHDEQRIDTDLTNLIQSLQNNELHGPVFILYGIASREASQLAQELPDVAKNFAQI